MKYATLCSGIGAPETAWKSLGWECAFNSEIEPFPCAVLKHHYPETPNVGDMTKYKEWKHEGTVDLICAGTPCQAFSVAGLRKGLDDPRGNLTLVFLGVLKQYRPRWLVWENVPGVLSIDNGKVFGTFLGGLAELGYGFAYRVLDAQYVRVESHARAVPQRRRRVFVVGYFGDWRPAAAVLFEQESLCRNTPPSRKAWEGTAADVGEGVEGSGGGGVAKMLKACANMKHREDSDTIIPMVARSVSCNNARGGIPKNNSLDCAIIPSVVNTLSDGAHNGGGLNGQDAYSGRIIPHSERRGNGKAGLGNGNAGGE